MTSIREQIIVADKNIIESVSFIKTVKRAKFKYEDLKNFALTQLPVAAVVGKLPTPEKYHMSGRRSETIGQIQSKLEVEIYIYFQQNVVENMDTKVSEYANEVFADLYDDSDRGGLCLNTFVEIQPEYAYWHPFVAFRVIASHNYIHNTGGI